MVNTVIHEQVSAPPRGDGWRPALWTNRIKLMLIDHLFVSAVEVQANGDIQITLKKRDRKQ